MLDLLVSLFRRSLPVANAAVATSPAAIAVAYALDNPTMQICFTLLQISVFGGLLWFLLEFNRRTPPPRPRAPWESDNEQR